MTIFILLSFLVIFSLVDKAYANNSSEKIVLINTVHQLLKVNGERLESNSIEALYDEITQNRQHYSNDIIAKVFLLSARVASNQGDINGVFSFATQGLAVNSLDKNIKLSLSLKLAEVYVAREQLQDLLELTTTLVNSSSINPNIKYYLLALSYRSVAFSMQGEHQLALNDLQQVEQNISSSEFSDRISILTIFALAYHHLGDYQMSLMMQQKILKLRFELDYQDNMAKTYLYLGYAFFYLQRFDDAYNAFWESEKSATLKGASINEAYAAKGLGLALLRLKKPQEALLSLKKSVEIFSAHNMLDERIESSVALAKTLILLNKTDQANLLLTNIVDLLDGKDIAFEYTGFNRMVADMYYAQKNYPLAYQWRRKDSQALLQKLELNKKNFNLLSKVYYQNLEGNLQTKPIEQSRKIAAKLAENSELSSSFIDKYKQQRLIIISLSILIFLLLFFLFALLIRLRANRINKAYEEIEKPSYAMCAPVQTKAHYQLSFKKARQYQYPICVAYLIIENWQELVFHFNRKAISEVIKDVASVINLQLGDFDYAGLLNEGEYLLLFEHQNNEEAEEKLLRLVQAINTRSFANLGEVSVTVKYSLNTPDFKDIDPYLFLARITESINIEKVNHPKAL